MVTEAVRGVLGDRVIGICDTPSGLCRRVARALGRAPEDMWFDYFGLNHLGWLQAAIDSDGDRLPELLADDEALAGFEEGRLFGGDWLRTLGMIPNEYLYYFYFGADTVSTIRAGQPRGAYLLESQAAFYAQNGQDPAAALGAWRATREERDRTYMAAERTTAGIEADHDDGGEVGGYEGEALAVVEAIANNTRAIMILNTANRSALPFLDEHAVVEVPAIVGRTGPVPVAIGPTPQHAQALVTTIKAVERTTIEAALSGSSELAVQRDRPAPAGAERHHRAAHLRRLPGAAARAAGALRLMGVDVVVTATAFMDLTFIGLESVPSPGEERFAGDLLRSPGGGAINAIGASRLGLRAALAVPLGEDLEGRFIREVLEGEGIELAIGDGARARRPRS